jgi:chemotaxis signal transduction protein
LCTFDDFSIGVPEDAVAAIIIYSGEAPAVIERTEKGDVYFSLPHFFQLENRTVRHGIVLKPQDQMLDRDDEGPRNILLVSAVERETDIPPEEIFPLPDIATSPERIPFFTGAWFTGPDMIAFIDPASLITRIIQDTEGGPAA